MARPFGTDQLFDLEHEAISAATCPIRNKLVFTKKDCTRLFEQDRQCKCIKNEYEGTYADSTVDDKFDL